MANSLIPLGAPAYDEERIRSLADASNRRKTFLRNNPGINSTPRLGAPPPVPSMTERMSQYSAKPSASMDSITRGMTQANRESIARAGVRPAPPPPAALSPNSPPAPGRGAGIMGRMGGLLAGGYEAYQTGKTALDPNATAADTAQQARSGALRLGGGALGAAAGSALGPVGTAGGGAAGYYAGDFVARKMNQAEREAPMTPEESKRFINMPLAARRAYGSGEDFSEWSGALPAPENQAAPPAATPSARAAVAGDVMGPDRSSGFSENVNRAGNRINTQGGYIESNDAAGMNRVDAGLRGVQPRDGQSYVSNNFMTVPAYQTPEWLIRARELKAQREQARASGGSRVPEMPQAPKLQKFDARTQSFSDLGNVKRQNRMAREQYALEMGAYNNAVDNTGATERQAMQNDALMQRQKLEQQGAMERMQAELAVQAPYRQAMSDYYKANADESRANAGWRQALASGQLGTRGQKSTPAGDNKLYSLDLGTDAQGNALRALGDPSSGALYRYDMGTGKLSPMQLPPAAAPLPAMSLEEFGPVARNILKSNEATRALEPDDELISQIYQQVYGQ